MENMEEIGHIFLFYFQLFENCLSHDTLGDGTGCDNMTAVIVRFKPTLAECKDVVSSEGQNSESAGARNICV